MRHFFFLLSSGESFTIFLRLLLLACYVLLFFFVLPLLLLRALDDLHRKIESRCISYGKSLIMRANIHMRMSESIVNLIAGGLNNNSNNKEQHETNTRPFNAKWDFVRGKENQTLLSIVWNPSFKSFNSRSPISFLVRFAECSWSLQRTFKLDQLCD